MIDPSLPSIEPQSAPPQGWRLWWQAVRPRTLLLAMAPVLAGAGVAWGWRHELAVLPLLATVAGALLIQMGTNLWNDVADGLRGGDPPQRLGPPRVTAQGWALPAHVRRAASLSFALAALIGVYLAVLGGWPILLLGVASLVAGWAYSGGPRPISASPFGEIFVIAFFGVGAVVGTVWLQLHALPPGSWQVGVAIGLPAAAVLMVNNLRDRECDRLTGRHTLAILLGLTGGRVAYGLFMLTPFAVLLAPGAPAGAWLGLAVFPWAVWQVWKFRLTDGRGFNLFLASTARFQVLLALLVALGAAKLG